MTSTAPSTTTTPTLRAFLHSHSYTGNPLACAAALATLDIFEEDNVIENNKALAQRMASSTAHLVDHPNVSRKCARPAWCWPSRWSRTKPPRKLTRGRNVAA